MEQYDMRAILVVFGVLTILTGLATETIKKVAWRELPTSLLAIFVAEGLTLGSGLTYALITGAAVLWWHAAAAVVAGRAVAYFAMLSYDKRIEIKKSLAKIKGEKNERKKRQNGEDAGMALYRRSPGRRCVGDGRKDRLPGE